MKEDSRKSVFFMHFQLHLQLRADVSKRIDFVFRIRTISIDFMMCKSCMYVNAVQR